MGKKRIEVIKKIDDHKTRKVTYCKRKKGLLKKSMELSVLCDLRLFLYIYDPSQQRVIHFASHPDLDLLDLFNHRNQREYYSNQDYEEIGGRFMNEQDDAISANDNEGSDSGRDFEEGSNGGGKKKVPFQTKQGRIKRDQEKKSSQLGNLISQRMTIPRNHVQRVILEDARCESDSSMNATDEQMKVIKRMSTNRIFITEKSDGNYLKPQNLPQRKLSQAFEQGKIDNQRLHQFFQNEFDVLKSMNSTYIGLLDRIFNDAYSMKYLTNLVNQKRVPQILETGLCSFDLNDQCFGDNQTNKAKQIIEISEKFNYQQELKQALFSDMNDSKANQPLDQMTIKDQLFDKVPLNLQNQSPSQQGFRLVKSPNNHKRTGSEPWAALNCDQHSQIITEFLQKFDAQLTFGEKQIVQHFNQSLIQLASSQNKLPFSCAKDNCVQQFLKTINIFKTILEKKQAGATDPKADKHDITQLMTSIKSSESMYQIYKEDTISTKPPSMMRMIDTKQQESIKKRENKFIQKMNEKPLAEMNESQMDKIIPMNPSSSGKYLPQSSIYGSRPLVRLSSDILLSKNIEEPKPIRYGLPSQSFKSSKWKNQMSPQNKVEAHQSSSNQFHQSNFKSQSGQFNAIFLNSGLQQPNVPQNISNLKKSDQAAASNSVQKLSQLQLQKNTSTSQEKQKPNQIRASGPILLNNKVPPLDMNNKDNQPAANPGNAQQQQPVSQTQTSNSKDASNLPPPPAVNNENQKQEAMNKPQQQVPRINTQIQNQKALRKRMTTGELLIDKTAQMQPPPDQIPPEKAQKNQQQQEIHTHAQQNKINNAKNNIVNPGPVDGSPQNPAGMMQPENQGSMIHQFQDSKASQNVTLSQFHQQVYQITEHPNNNNQIMSQKILKRKMSQSIFQNSQNKIRMININGRMTPIIIQSISSQISSEKNQQIQSQIGQQIYIQVPNGQQQIYQQGNNAHLKAVDFNPNEQMQMNQQYQMQNQTQQYNPNANKMLPPNQVQMLPPSHYDNYGNKQFVNGGEPVIDGNQQQYIQNNQKNVEQTQVITMKQMEDKMGQGNQVTQMIGPHKVVQAQRIETSSLQKYYQNQIQKQQMIQQQTQMQMVSQQQPNIPQKHTPSGTPGGLQLPSNAMLNKLSGELNNDNNNSEKCIEVLIKGNNIYRKISLGNNNNQQQQSNTNINKAICQQDIQHQPNKHGSSQVPQQYSNFMNMPQQVTANGTKQNQIEDKYLLNKLQPHMFQSGEQVQLSTPDQVQYNMPYNGNQYEMQNMNANMQNFGMNKRGGHYIQQQSITQPLQQSFESKQSGQQIKNFNDQRLRMKDYMGKDDNEYSQYMYMNDQKLYMPPKTARMQSNEYQQNWPFFQPDNDDEKDHYSQNMYRDQNYGGGGMNGPKSALSSKLMHISQHKNLQSTLIYQDNIGLNDQQNNPGQQKVKKYEIIEIGDSNMLNLNNKNNNGPQIIQKIGSQQIQQLPTFEVAYAQNQYQMNDQNIMENKNRNTGGVEFLDTQMRPQKKISNQQHNIMINNRIYEAQKQQQQIPQINDNVPQKFAQFQVKNGGQDDNYEQMEEQVERYDMQLNQNNIQMNNQAANYQNHQQQQWCAKSTMTHDTMSDISKLNLTSLSVINRQANEQDCQSNNDGPLAAQQNQNYDNHSQIRKLKARQLSKFNPKYNQTQNTQIVNQSFMNPLQHNPMQQNPLQQQQNQDIQIQMNMQQQNERIVKVDHQQNNMNMPQFNNRMALQQQHPNPQFIDSQRNSSILEVQKFGGEQPANQHQKSHQNEQFIMQNQNMYQTGNDNIVKNQILVEENVGQQQQQQQQKNHQFNVQSPYQQQNQPKARYKYSPRTNNVNNFDNQHEVEKSNVDIGQELRKVQYESNDHVAKTENQINHRLITEQNDNSPEQNENEGTKYKVVNLLNDMDTDNISDNASNYTMFLINQNTGHPIMQPYMDQMNGNGHVNKQRFMQRNMKNGNQQHNNSSSRMQRATEATKLQDFADKERHRAKNDIHEHVQSQSTLNCRNVFAKNTALSERHDDDGGSQAHSASAHSDFQYRNNIKRPVKHEVTGCFARNAEFINSKASQSQKSYNNQQNNVVHPTEVQQQPQDKSNQNLPVPQRFESHLSFFKNNQEQQMNGADGEIQRPVPQISMNNLQSHADLQNVENPKDRAMMAQYQREHKHRAQGGVDRGDDAQLEYVQASGANAHMGQKIHQENDQYYRGQHKQNDLNYPGPDGHQMAVHHDPADQQQWSQQYQAVGIMQPDQQQQMMHGGQNVAYAPQMQYDQYQMNQGVEVANNVQGQRHPDNSARLDSQQQRISRPVSGEQQQPGTPMNKKKNYKAMSFLPEDLRNEFDEQDRKKEMKQQQQLATAAEGGARHNSKQLNVSQQQPAAGGAMMKNADQIAAANKRQMQGQMMAQSMKNGMPSGAADSERPRSIGKTNRSSVRRGGFNPHSQHTSKRNRNDDSDSESIDGLDHQSKSMSHNH